MANSRKSWPPGKGLPKDEAGNFIVSQELSDVVHDLSRLPGGKDAGDEQREVPIPDTAGRRCFVGRCSFQVRFGKAALAGSIARNLQSDLIQLGQARPEAAIRPTIAVCGPGRACRSKKPLVWPTVADMDLSV